MKKVKNKESSSDKEILLELVFFINCRMFFWMGMNIQPSEYLIDDHGGWKWTIILESIKFYQRVC